MSDWSQVAAAYAFGQAQGRLGLRVANHFSNKFSGRDNRIIDYHHYEELFDKYTGMCQSVTDAIDQMQVTMTYINSLRIINGGIPVTYDEVKAIVQSNDLMKDVHQRVVKAADKSDYGRFTQQKNYWVDVYNNALLPFYRELKGNNLKDIKLLEFRLQVGADKPEAAALNYQIKHQSSEKTSRDISQEFSAFREESNEVRRLYQEVYAEYRKTFEDLQKTKNELAEAQKQLKELQAANQKTKKLSLQTLLKLKTYQEKHG